MFSVALTPELCQQVRNLYQVLIDSPASRSFVEGCTCHDETPDWFSSHPQIWSDYTEDPDALETFNKGGYLLLEEAANNDLTAEEGPLEPFRDAQVHVVAEDPAEHKVYWSVVPANGGVREESARIPVDVFLSRAKPAKQEATVCRVEIPKHDHDVVLEFPGGREILIQSRPSNADKGNAGSLDIILPGHLLVTSWMGDDMQPAPAPLPERQEDRLTHQLVMELPSC
jgi:hypothetical protein